MPHTSATPSRHRLPPHIGVVLRKFTLAAYAISFFCALYLPIGLLLFLSVNDSPAMSASFGGFTGRWYGTVFSSPPLLQAIFNSMLLGVLSSAIAVALAVSLALALRHH